MTIKRCGEAVLAFFAAGNTNVPDTCQMAVRGYFDAPSAGDRDKDGDADATDGWLSEPVKYRVVGDRNPPPGVPLYFRNRSNPNGNGHRAISLNNAVGSTDMWENRYARGRRSAVRASTTSNAIAIIEEQMNLEYVGWSKSIDGFLIPNFIKNPVKKMTEGWRVRKARKLIAQAQAKPGSKRESFLQQLLAMIKRTPKIPKKH